MLFFLSYIASSQMFDMTAMMASPQIMLQRGEIKKELKVTRDEAKQLDELNKQYQELMKAGSKDPATALTAFKKGDEVGEQMRAVLDDGQKARFRELQLQCLGPSALLQEDVRTSLGLAPEQTDAIKAAKKEASDGMLDAARNGKMGNKTMENLVKAYEEKAMKALTPEQTEKFKALQGKPFKDARPKGMPPF